MKYNNILNKVMGVALAALSLTACTDTWNDHYDAANGLNGGVDATLWQTISTDQQFSNFAKVVKACGYDRSLNSSQMFTVFAPTNSNFTLEEADKLIETYNAEKAAGIIEKAELFVVIGTSLKVYPAINLLMYPPANVPFYIIDPKTKYRDGFHKVTHIESVATEGVERLVSELNLL